MNLLQSAQWLKRLHCLKYRRSYIVRLSLDCHSDTEHGKLNLPHDLPTHTTLYLGIKSDQICTGNI